MSISASKSERPVNPDGSAADQTEQFLSFVLGHEEYGVDILKVEGIQCFGGATPLPNTPDYVLGVFNLRGSIVPVVDLRLRFRIGEPVYTPTTVTIIVRVRETLDGEVHERVVGMVVDAVSDVHQIASASLQPPPDLGANVSVGFIRGLACEDDRMIMVLDVDRLISDGVLNVARAAA